MATVPRARRREPRTGGVTSKGTSRGTHDPLRRTAIGIKPHTTVILLAIALLPAASRLAGHALPVYEIDMGMHRMVVVAPYLLLVLAAVLGMKLNQMRILSTAVLFGWCYALLLQPEIRSYLSAPTPVVASTLSISVPAALLVIVALGEGPAASATGVLRLVAPIALPVAPLLAASSGLVPSWLSPSPHRLPWGALHLPPYAAAAFVVPLAMAYVLRSSPLRPFYHTLAVAALPLLAALENAARTPAPAPADQRYTAYNFTALALVLLYGVYRLYWQRVYYDELTGVLNRRAYDEALERLGRGFSIAMIDIDHFKKFNDTWGHETGDEVLRFVARFLDENAGAKVYRYGGEEFALIYESASKGYVAEVVDGLRDALSQREFYIRLPRTIRKQRSKKDRGRRKVHNKKVRITFSAGVAGAGKGEKRPEEVARAADKALYRAKARGRNRVVAA